MSPRIVAGLLFVAPALAALAGCASTGAGGAETVPGGRFAVLAGARPDDEPLLQQLRLERAQELVLAALGERLAQASGERFVPPPDAQTRYGKLEVPVVLPEGRAPAACTPLTAAYVRERIGVQFFLILWAPGSLAAEQRGSFRIDAFSAEDCRSLGSWTARGEREFAPARVANDLFYRVRAPLGVR